MAQVGEEQEEPPAPVVFGATVTILFTDIRGFTEYTDASGDEAGYRMLQHHNSLVSEQVELHGGHIVKALGDSFMVSFEAARSAVLCAVAIQRVLDEHNRSQSGPNIEVGIGINTGEPVREAGDLLGGAVNLASRICAAAGPGQILGSETVRRVVGRIQGSEWIDRGLFELKGFREPQHLFEVDVSGESSRPASPVAPRESVRTQPALPRVPGQAIETRGFPMPRLAVVAGVVILVGASAGLAFFALRNSLQPPLPETGASPPDSSRRASVPGSDASPVAIRTLISPEPIGALLAPPVCVKVNKATVAGGGVRPIRGGYHQHGSILVYQVESAHRVEYPDRPSVTLAPGEALFIDAETPHIHVNPTRTSGTELVISLLCGGSGPGTLVGVSDPLPGIPTGPAAVTLVQLSGPPGSRGARQQASGPLTLFLLEGSLVISTNTGVTQHGPGDLMVIPPHSAFEVSVAGTAPARALGMLLAPADDRRSGRRQADWLSRVPLAVIVDATLNYRAGASRPDRGPAAP